VCVSVYIYICLYIYISTCLTYLIDLSVKSIYLICLSICLPVWSNLSHISVFLICRSYVTTHRSIQASLSYIYLVPASSSSRRLLRQCCTNKPISGTDQYHRRAVSLSVLAPSVDSRPSVCLMAAHSRSIGVTYLWHRAVCISDAVRVLVPATVSCCRNYSVTFCAVPLGNHQLVQPAHCFTVQYHSTNNYFIVCTLFNDASSWAGVAQSGWTTGRSRFDPRQRQRILPLSSVSRPALGPTQPPVQWVPGVLSPGVKRGRDVSCLYILLQPFPLVASKALP
jgi:hypothetical protein